MLASGQGTNLEAILGAIERGEVAGRVVLVVSDQAEAPVLKRARRHLVKALFIDPIKFVCREEYDRAILEELRKAEVELVVLAGFMRLLSPAFVREYPWRIMNIHPSLLPAFPGTNGVKQALDYGAKITGCTVHFVDEGLDTGPVILQEAVSVIQEDTAETLRQRVHAAEYRLYPRAIDLYCRGKLSLEGKKCYIREQS